MPVSSITCTFARTDSFAARRATSCAPATLVTLRIAPRRMAASSSERVCPMYTPSTGRRIMVGTSTVSSCSASSSVATASMSATGAGRLGV